MFKHSITKIVTKVKKHPKLYLGCFLIVLLYYFCLPSQLFKTPTSTVIISKSGDLLGARIASDGQWRFPKSDSIPEKFKTCIIAFEDAYFEYHIGFNPVSMINAIKQNYRAGKVVRGGSTLTQQVIRLSRENKSRSYWEKLIELVLATRLEWRYSKSEILSYYAAYAPFGGNVVGLEAASWRYFNRSAYDLSWAETATLAVLPNAPGLIYPGRNQQTLLEKRNRLLKKLLDEGTIDQLTYESALLEGLPQKPYPLPQLAPHLLTRIEQKKKGTYQKTTIDYHIQEQANRVLKRHYNQLSKNKIYNGAILVLDVKTREVLAYVGNTPTSTQHENAVDNIIAPRSTGSILKPFLYAGLYDEGLILPQQLVKDIPTQMANFSPQNFDETYSGLLPSTQALSRSLNIPAVRLLQLYNHTKFYDVLKSMDFRDLRFNSDHYGLSLILGGAECSLWDVTKNFAALNSTLQRYEEEFGVYAKGEFCNPVYLDGEVIEFGERTDEKVIFDVSSIYETFEALKLVNRPKNDQAWKYFSSSQDIAWKTGTSYGFRDAWAVGSTQDYVVGVWIGNSDGEGRPGITGVLSAAPVMFDVFDALPRSSSWSGQPISDYRLTEVCSESGYIATDICPKTKVSVPKNGLQASSCPYHQIVHLNKNRTKRVDLSCVDASEMITESRFVLPPLIEWYYKNTNPKYKPLPPYDKSCEKTQTKIMDFIYPSRQMEIYLPNNRLGERTDLVLAIAHAEDDAVLFWYMDEEFIGETQTFHTLTARPSKGKHQITVIDDKGRSIRRTIKVMN